MQDLAQTLLKQSQEPFSVIEEFAALNPQRKMLLCDNLFMDGRSAFQKTVTLLWPEASDKDMIKLERFLAVLKKTAH